MQPTHDFPEIFFLPLAVPDPEAFGEVDAGILARRIPDFLQQLVNRGVPGPAGMLEVQSPPDEGPVRWEMFRECPEAEDAFAMIPEEEPVRAVVFGEIECASMGYQARIQVATTPNETQGETLVEVRAQLRSTHLVEDLVRLAATLARVLGLESAALPPRRLLTADRAAFLSFLEGLDGAALLSGDLAIEVPSDGREALLRPFLDALAKDPGFGLALRVAHTSVVHALEFERLDSQSCVDFLDRCFEASPGDQDGCVAIADQLVIMGEEGRAEDWYRHAVEEDGDPPARGLENLAILLANRGETEQARALWQRGLETDGHPDFFAHLARLAFAEERDLDAWDNVLGALRRLRERCVRPGEWDVDDERGAGVVLRYLVEHLTDLPSPEEVGEGLLELVGLLSEDEDRVDLGLCLLASGFRREARDELVGGIDGELSPGLRDRAVRAMLTLDDPEFERRFAQAVEQATEGRRPAQSLSILQRFAEKQPGFWPALFYTAVARRRMGEDDRALDVLADVLAIRPHQPDALAQMAELFDERGNPKRAVECADEALTERPEDPGLLCRRSEALLHLDRWPEARRSWLRAQEADGDHPAVKALGPRFKVK